MRIALDQIPKPCRTVAFTLASDDDRAVVSEALEGDVNALEGSLRIERHKADISVRVQGAATVVRSCDRCGADVVVDVPVDTTLRFRPPEHIPAGEYELSEAELDVGFLEEEAVHTEHVLSEAFALAAPIRVTCAGDVCADHQAVDEVDADEAKAPNPFAALKDYF